MSVIVARALPDVRDGLKPVHRRILYAMNESGYHAQSPAHASRHVRLATLSVSTTRMATLRCTTPWFAWLRPFSMRVPLVDGHGNFGSIDGDSAAAMRYTEARLD